MRLLAAHQGSDLFPPTFGIADDGFVVTSISILGMLLVFQVSKVSKDEVNPRSPWTKCTTHARNHEEGK
jgi:hypothetical protein